MLQAAAGQLVAERAQQQVGVGGGHDGGAMARTLVLLHGFTHTGASWDPVRSELGERYRALAPDLPGHGAASTWEPITLERVIADLGSLAEGRFTLKRAHAGHASVRVTGESIQSVWLDANVSGPALDDLLVNPPAPTPEYEYQEYSEE